ncbi:MAG TPA: hypothetical protein VFV80_00470 [Geminicoccaceae bacterium]|nr:hypothetical protein [Geminicoccaceae bacterium]
MSWRLRILFCLAASLLAAGIPGQAGEPPPGGDGAPPLEVAAPAAPHGMLAEVLKQAAEQPLHFAMSAGPIWLSRCLTAVPWYGWAMVPALAYREWRQWPSKRWWDPALDATFLVLGVVVATWSGETLRAPPLVAPPRRGWRDALMRLASRLLWTRPVAPIREASRSM